MLPGDGTDPEIIIAGRRGAQMKGVGSMENASHLELGSKNPGAILLLPGDRRRCPGRSSPC